jgi:hypothetical protein
MTDIKHKTELTASKHTPGPWRHSDKTSIPGNEMVYAPDNYLVANVGAYKRANEENQANARLIAAAPRVLEALELMVSWAERHNLTKAVLITGGYAELPVIGIARKAIAEATDDSIGRVSV